MIQSNENLWILFLKRRFKKKEAPDKNVQNLQIFKPIKEGFNQARQHEINQIDKSSQIFNPFNKTNMGHLTKER